MATQPKLEVSFFERLGDGITNVTESLLGFFTRILGTANDRQVAKLGYVRLKNADPPYRITPGSLLDRINSLEPSMKALSDAELKELTPKFRERLAKGATLDSLLPEAYAACREAGRRTKGMRHYDVQIIGGIVLHGGNIAEMVTGEGKTLVATLPAYLNALTGLGVHVITVNDYLARRDCEWMLPIYQALGVTAGYIQSHMESPDRWKAYDCDITYGTNSEFGFDYLRDNMKPARRGDENYPPWYQQAQRALNFAIIDEVDNILIDEARTPLIISGPAFSDVKNYEKANQVALQLTELQKKEPGVYFEVKEKEHTCHLTDEGIRKAEELAGVESFYTAGNMEWPHLIDNALKAHHLYKRDRNYMIAPDRDNPRELAIVIIDEFTGRAMEGRQWSDGLHQAVEAKHARDGVKIKQETQTLATITLQNFFKLYKKLAGMTGTAMTEANEFWKIYKLDVVAIPTNRALKRINHPDLIYRTDKEKWDAILREIEEVHRTGRPILVGTTDVAKSERLSGMLKRRGIKHELLNAKPENVAREAEIVAQAGRLGAVTIATNMAGRGTDIILGGNPETLAWAKLKQLKAEQGYPLYPTRLEVPEDVWRKTVEEIEAKEKMKEEGRKVAELGGLHIIGTERHESRRIDNQLRGRAGRQGDPGSSRFFLSLQDDLMRIFAGEWVSRVLTSMGMEEGQAIESRMVSRQIEGAQKKVEERNFDVRKNLLEYDEVMDKQRKRTYGERQAILDGQNCKLVILRYIDEIIDDNVEEFLDPLYGPATFASFVSSRLMVEFEPTDFKNCDFTAAEQFAKDKAIRMVQTVIQDGLDENLSEDEDPKDWKWEAMSRLVNNRYGLKTTEKQLKQIGREQLSSHLTDECNQAVEATDLSEGRAYLESDWGRKSVISWAKKKFLVELTYEEIKDLEADGLTKLLRSRVRAMYRQKDIEFPIQVAFAQFMGERNNSTRVDRQGLFEWATLRFSDLHKHISEEVFRTESRAKLRELLMEVSRKYMPEIEQEVIDEKIEEVFEGTHTAEADDAEELVNWAKAKLGIEPGADQLTGATRDQARQVLWNAFDRHYRSEMHTMERKLLLNQIDSAWKQHLLTMDHLRAAVGLRGWAQLDAKSEYKREGMQEFERMWKGLKDRMTDVVFRMEEADIEGVVFQVTNTTHASYRSLASEAQDTPMITNSNEAPKKTEPIRNLTARIGRNDPCHCGSGKKYKNCHMRLETPQAKR